MDDHPLIRNHKDFILIADEYLYALENHNEKVMDKKIDDAVEYLINLRNSYIKDAIYPRYKTIPGAEKTKKEALAKAIKEIGDYIQFESKLPPKKMIAVVGFLNLVIKKHLADNVQKNLAYKANRIPASSNEDFPDADTLQTNPTVLAEETVKDFVKTQDRKSFNDAYQILTQMIAAKITSKRSKEPVDNIAVSKAALDSRKEIIAYLKAQNSSFEVIGAASILFGHAIAKIATESKEGNLPKDGILQTKPPEKFERIQLSF